MGKERERKFLWGTLPILAVIAIEIYVPNILPIFEWVTSLFERGGFFDYPQTNHWTNHAWRHDFCYFYWLSNLIYTYLPGFWLWNMGLELQTDRPLDDIEH